MSSIKPATSYFPFEQGGLLPQAEMAMLQKKDRELTIGIPKEENCDESRIPLTPQAVGLLTQRGHKIILESDAGLGANYTDKNYAKYGAHISSNKADIYKTDILLKISPFKQAEINMLKERQIIFSSFNISTQNVQNVRSLMKKKVTAFAFEYICDEQSSPPIVHSMSEIAGATAILIASEYLSNENEGKGVLLGGITGVRPTSIVILGADTASEYAARTALGLGALVNVFDSSLYKLRKLQHNLGLQIFTSVFQPQVLKQVLKNADVVIGTIHQLEKRHRFIVTEDMVRIMKPNSVIVDIGIDQGGCVETSRLTTHKEPVFRKHDVIHYCVPNITSRVARTASIALSNIFVPILLNFGEAGSANKILHEDLGLRKGVYIYNGILTNSHIGNTFDLPVSDINIFMVAL